MYRTEGHERISFPSALFIAENGERHGVWGMGGAYPALREAALSAGATQVNEGPLEPMGAPFEFAKRLPYRPEPLDRIAAIRHFGRCATRELEVLADRPGPVVQAELWALARDWKLKPSPALTGTIWELA